MIKPINNHQPLKTPKTLLFLMQITKNIEIIDLSLYIPKHKTLIIADLHIGYEESLNKQGVLVPRQGFKQLVQRLEKILKKI